MLASALVLPQILEPELESVRFRGELSMCRVGDLLAMDFPALPWN